MSLHVGWQFLGHVPLERTLGADANRPYGRSKQIGLGAKKKTCLWWTKHECFRSREWCDFGHQEDASNFSSKNNSRYWVVLWIVKGAVEERLQSAKKACWKDIMTHKCKDVPWKVKCQRLVDHVYAVFTLESENWSWTQQTMEKSKDGKPRRWHDYSVWKDVRTRRGSNTTRERVIWTRRNGCRCACPSYEKKLQKVCGEPWDGFVMKRWMQWSTPSKKSPNWQVRDEALLTTTMMKRDRQHHTRWKCIWWWHNRESVWEKMSISWAGTEDYWSEKEEKYTRGEVQVRQFHSEQNEVVHRTQKNQK